VLVPKVGAVRIRQSQRVDGETKSATFKQDAVGHWYVTLVSEFETPDAALPPAVPEAVVGVDLGLKDFAVLSDGARVAAPRFIRRAARKLRRVQRA
jgi:putative transposase